MAVAVVAASLEGDKKKCVAAVSEEWRAAAGLAKVVANAACPKSREHCWYSSKQPDAADYYQYQRSATRRKVKRLEYFL